MVVCLGCGQKGLSGLAPVSGVVTYKGSPVEGATVTFSPQGAGRAAAGTTGADGRFTLTTLQPGDGAMPGEYGVAVSKVKTISQELSNEEMQKYIEEHGGPPPTETQSLLPEKYARADSSGLTATVKEGEENKFEFPLE
jgi:hypothetical protein